MDKATFFALDLDADGVISVTEFDEDIFVAN